MALSKYKLGELIEQCDQRNSDNEYILDDVRGISTGKEFISTKANMDGVGLLTYKVVAQREFAYVADTSRRGEKIAIAFNTGDKPILISSIYTVFRVNQNEKLVSDYLFMFFNRPEFDRYARFNSWGSARESFDWDALCDIDIELPDLPTQQKYVDIYNAMVANQQAYERGLDDLKLTCDAYIEDLRRRMPCERIGKYIEPTDTTNVDLQYGINDVRGISIEKKLIETKADMEGINLSPYLLIQPNEFSYVTVTSRNGGKISIALNDSNKTYICSSSYVVFKSKDMEELLPQYLMLFFSRAGFDRYARFHSWGSARETFDWDNMCDVKIPIPDITIQKSIAEMYTVYNTRKRINERLKTQIKDICPILIKGSLEEN